MLPRIGVSLGDATGIGPELVAKLLDGYDVKGADIVIVGDRRVFEMGQKIAGVRCSARVVERFEDVVFDAGLLHFLHWPGVSPDEIVVGQLSGKAGKAVLDELGALLDLGLQRKIDAVLYAPLNKEAQRLGGSPFPDEGYFMADRLRWTGYHSEINMLGNLWTSRVTSHIALEEVGQRITKAAVLQSILHIHNALQMAGVKEPRLLVAALNPHAGDGGLYGNQESEAIAPAVAEAQSQGIRASGPFPADTIFLRAKGGDCDAVVSMYHDQGQIAMKLMGFERGVSVDFVQPFPILTPSHGTAFEIAGQGKANPQAFHEAFQVACRMGASLREAS